MPIIERPLYGRVKIETSPWSTPFVWTDRTAELVAGINYSEGGRIGTPGSSQVDVGTLNATFRNLSSVPVVGDLVRISFNDFSGYAFTGYVQDVSERIVFDQSVSFTTPVTLTTINCLDWVGYVSQFKIEGLGGVDATTGVAETDSKYSTRQRVAAINKAIDASFATQIVSPPGSSSTLMGDTDLVGSITEHLDLSSNTFGDVWYGNHILPTNKTTGRTSLIKVDLRSAVASSGKTFTDLVGSAGQLHYTEIDLQNSSANVVNELVFNNRTRVAVVQPEITKVGGYNLENFMIVNGTPTFGVPVDHKWTQSDSTSITTYGNRQASVDTNVGLDIGHFNFVINPSVEYSDDGYTRNNTNCVVRRRQPSQDANPFESFNGLWAMRSRQTVASPNARILFSAGEADGQAVISNGSYTFNWRAARGTVSRTDMRANLRVFWYDDAETLISTSSTASTNLTNANTWYLVGGSLQAPATAVRATIEILFERSGGGNITIGDRLWADGLYMGFAISGNPYFDGDTPWTNTFAYGWYGGVGASASFRADNALDSFANNVLSRYSTTSMRVTRIRWNAQEDLTAVPALSVGKTISIIYKGTTTTYRIVGIDGNIDPSRYMIDYYVEKV